MTAEFQVIFGKFSDQFIIISDSLITLGRCRQNESATGTTLRLRLTFNGHSCENQPHTLLCWYTKHEQLRMVVSKAIRRALNLSCKVVLYSFWVVADIRMTATEKLIFGKSPIILKYFVCAPTLISLADLLKQCQGQGTTI